MTLLTLMSKSQVLKEVAQNENEGKQLPASQSLFPAKGVERNSFQFAIHIDPEEFTTAQLGVGAGLRKKGCVLIKLIGSSQSGIELSPLTSHGKLSNFDRI